MKTLQQAAQQLLGFVQQRHNAFRAAQAKGYIMGNHPAFNYCAALEPHLRHVAQGETQRWHIAEVVKHTPQLYFICSRKAGTAKQNQEAKINQCISLMRAFLYPNSIHQ